MTCSFRFLSFSLFFFVNIPQALQISASYLSFGCLSSPCILGMNLSPADRNLFIILFILYSQNKTEPNMGILLKDAFVLEPLNNHLPSCSLTNFDFLLPQMAQFDISNFRFFSWQPLGFACCFFYTSNNKITLLMSTLKVLINWWSLKANFFFHIIVLL